jgi:acyl-CoA synthetase (AMP-forming)/AMP-acid ligase II
MDQCPGARDLRPRRPSCCLPADVAGGRVRRADAMTVIDQRDGTCVPPGGQALGEVIIRGNITMKGYLKDPGATQQAFSGGWVPLRRPGCTRARRLREDQRPGQGRDRLRWDNLAPPTGCQPLVIDPAARPAQDPNHAR